AFPWFMPVVYTVRVSSCGRWQAHAMSSPTSPITCPACRVIDQADGVEDGNLFKVEHYAVKNENKLLEAVMQAQDRVADKITAFAGSLNFVYLHSVWFGVWVLINVGLIGAS